MPPAKKRKKKKKEAAPKISRLELIRQRNEIFRRVRREIESGRVSDQDLMDNLSVEDDDHGI
jgi:hypothetical protein